MQVPICICGLIIFSSLTLLMGCGLMDNNISMWTSAKICYYEDIESYTSNIPPIMEVEKYEDIKKLESIVESMLREPTNTSRPMGFPRYVVTFYGEDNVSLSFSVDSESVFTTDSLDNGNYIQSAEYNPYSEISTVYKISK